jgi:hypothetical protein
MTTLPATTRTNLTPEQQKDLVLSSNHTGPVSIKGIARGRVRNTPIEAFFVVYEVAGIIDRAQISEEFYSQLRTLFAAIHNEHPEAIFKFIQETAKSKNESFNKGN